MDLIHIDVQEAPKFSLKVKLSLFIFLYNSVFVQ